VIAATRILYDILSGHSPTRASRAAEKAHEFFEVSLKRNATQVKTECNKGCAFCCHVSVSVLAPEVFLLANSIRTQYAADIDSRLARVRAAERLTHRLSAFERARRRLPCALLENNACIAYAARPGPCRGMSSASAAACERAFRGLPGGIPTPAVWSTLHNASLQALMAALTASGLSAEAYDLNEAVCVALDNPQAEARWLKGDDVFAGVARMGIAHENPAVAENNRKIIGQLIAGALGKELPAPG
jgi:hypothetical protein